MLKLLYIFIITAILITFQSAAHVELQTVTLSSYEREIYTLINDYRAKKKLDPVQLSPALTKVARTHCYDLVNYHPVKGRCNLHSWSKKGDWEGCCYTPNHANAECMWNKPRELTSYKGNGYEICYWSSDTSSVHLYASSALKSWKASPGHNSVIINRDIWKSVKWQAVGIGVLGGYACVWFGEETDPSGSLTNSK